ncbi:hypothetical protein BIW11_07762 [Tropilaelaps mercedesae]|uniref:Uncharacterized protein n=1 Tax=Tropilaelaps mercedesae TaxID=418985 RepID=A0A1V9XSK2_9ACAR|nr:hypothetical protein BIW11_07762 [Tropilaelaps mercedesae]
MTFTSIRYCLFQVSYVSSLSRSIEDYVSIDMSRPEDGTGSACLCVSGFGDDTGKIRRLCWQNAHPARSADRLMTMTVHLDAVQRASRRYIYVSRNTLARKYDTPKPEKEERTQDQDNIVSEIDARNIRQLSWLKTS